MKLAYGVKLIDFIILLTRTITCFVFGYYACWKLSLPVTVLLPISVMFFVLNIYVSLCKLFNNKKKFLND